MNREYSEEEICQIKNLLVDKIVSISKWNIDVKKNPQLKNPESDISLVRLTDLYDKINSGSVVNFDSREIDIINKTISSELARLKLVTINESVNHENVPHVSNDNLDAMNFCLSILRKSGFLD